MKSAVTTISTQDLAKNGSKGKVEKKSGKRIGYNYIILKSLKESRKNDVVKCLYIKSLTKFGFCIIKEGCYGDTKDRYGRDIKDRLLWQKQLHEKLHGKVQIPKLIGSFEENGNYYLVLEYIKGNPLYETYRRKRKEVREALTKGYKIGFIFLDYILQIINIIKSLHRYQIVHRDITIGNFMIKPDHKVFIIDMELSYSLKHQFPSPPFELGTYGYMSPEQKASKTPTVKEDIFALGAIMFYIWTGVSPIKIVDAGTLTELEDKMNFLIPNKEVANIIAHCLSPITDKRPSLDSVHNVLSRYKVDLQNEKNRSLQKKTNFNKEESLATIQQAVNTLASPLLADQAKGWFSESIQNSAKLDKTKLNKAWYASFNRGASGIIYMLSQAKKVGLDVTRNFPYIERGIELVKERYILNTNTTSSGLHFGSDGIAVCLLAARENNLINLQTEFSDWIEKLLETRVQSFGIMQGVAGQGIANLVSQSFLNNLKINERLQNYVQYLLDCQEKDGSWTRSITSKKKRKTRGFGNGVAGIIYFLLEYAQKYPQNEVLASSHRALEWLIKKSIKRGDTVEWLSSTNKKVDPWWCEGAAGIALPFLKAYNILGDAKYAEYARKALYNHDKNVISNNLSQCYGLSGLGEIYLEAYEQLKDEQWLERANWIASVIIKLKKQDDAFGTYWLVADERNPIANFMLGNSGVIHFLLRHQYSDKIAYPLSPNR
jgi:serine/threonine protein kinase